MNHLKRNETTYKSENDLEPVLDPRKALRNHLANRDGGSLGPPIRRHARIRLLIVLMEPLDLVQQRAILCFALADDGGGTDRDEVA
jgi:hypothetical protein